MLFRSRAGTDSNTAGTSITIAAGAGTGNAAVTGAVINLQVPVAVASGTGQQTLTTQLAIASGTLTVTEATNYVYGTSTGTKHGTATSQKQSWWNATPVIQPSAISDASSGAVIDTQARTAINSLLAAVRTIGIIAT